jgi:Prp8 binding protein
MAEEDGRIVPVKRDREGEGGGLAEKRLRPETRATLALVEAHGIQRTSGLVAPTMLLSGHSAPVYSIDFDPSGQHLASGSFDRSIMLWEVFCEGENNYNVLSGHKNAVLTVRWTADGSGLVSASADKTVALWDANKGMRKKSFKGHGGVVNSCCVSAAAGDLIGSGCDDCSVRLWDPRLGRSPAATMTTEFQVTAVEFGGENTLYSGGVDGVVRGWDLRKQEVAMELAGHSDIITSMRLHPTGTHLLSNSMDRTLRSWDVRPYTGARSRCSKVYVGATHAADSNLLGCSWSPKGDMISAGSADRVVHIWAASTAEELYYLPGHSGTVNDVCFHPKESIVASCGSDKQVYMGEL